MRKCLNVDITSRLVLDVIQTHVSDVINVANCCALTASELEHNSWLFSVV